MMFDEKDPIGRDAHNLADSILDPQLIEHPRGHRFAEHAVRARGCRNRRTDNSIELDEGFLEERDVIKVGATQPVAFEAETDGALGKREVMFDPAESLFFG